MSTSIKMEVSIEPRIRARVVQLKQEREGLIRQVFAYDAAIGELEALLNPENQPGDGNEQGSEPEQPEDIDDGDTDLEEEEAAALDLPT